MTGADAHDVRSWKDDGICRADTYTGSARWGQTVFMARAGGAQHWDVQPERYRQGCWITPFQLASTVTGKPLIDGAAPGIFQMLRAVSSMPLDLCA